MRAWFCALGVAAFARTAGAQGLPPWVPPGHLPLPDDAHSVEILARNEPLYAAPNPAAPRRGAAELGVRLPLYAAQPGPGCRSEWLLVGPTAWVCADVVRVSSTPASERDDAQVTADGMPRPYYFVGEDGTFGYGALATAGEVKPSTVLEPGFAVSVTRSARGPRGDAFGLTNKGFWLPLRDLRPARPATFRGYEPVSGALDRGWVVVDAASVRSSPAGPRADVRTLRRFDTVPLLERREAKGRSWVRVDEHAWLEENDVRAPVLSAPPEGLRPGERWVDVDLANQVVTAYEGTKPIFTTLASTGTGKGQEPTATPIGVHRIWVKLRSSDMDNLEDEDAKRYYAMQDVPWVLFFKKGAGLHGAFWHSSFGQVRSHGCVNLTPLDAERLFRWSSPALPSGWSAALPTDYDPGTMVRVR